MAHLSCQTAPTVKYQSIRVERVGQPAAILSGQVQKIRRLVFWQNMPSHHQAETIRRLATEHDFDVTWAVETPGLEAERASMGWPELAPDEVNLVGAPSPEQIRKIIDQAIPETLHVFGGIFLNPMVRHAFKLAADAGGRLAFLTEPPMPEEFSPGNPLKRVLRKATPILHRTVHRRFGSQIEAIFAIGSMAGRFYSEIGYPADKIFEWGYFPQVPAPLNRAPQSGPFRIFFAGGLNRRKGPDVLVESLAELRDPSWELTLVGEGELQSHLQARIESEGWQDRVRIEPFRPWAEMLETLADSDLAVVPSRHDGWGALTNEALASGVPAIVTDRCGSADLIGPGRGQVVSANDPQSLGKAIAQQIERGKPSEADRTALIEWSGCIQPESAASYFAGCLRGPKPTAPWR